MRQAARKSIGQALAELTAEFPDEDIKESKLRFLEAEGLVEPERTPSGYRKYSTQDMERLRYIIRAQREHYLPLKVIREHLEAMDRGLEPPSLNGGPTVPVGVLGDGTAAAELLRSDRGDVRISRRELIKTAEITEELLEQLETYGLVHTRAGSRQHYDGDALVVAKTAGALAAFGIEPRHLRAFKTAADREVGLVEQVVTPIRRSREDGAEGRAAQAVDEIAALSLRLHATLVRSGLRALR
ncbi:MerR family transcriptional regulator [Nocardioides pocheonensis]|uniref:MerR family transcriptional regulator n=1 Tax=Nocardioides pocheonensis TaxID=661485 RepID=A0A3N0GF95_9ACTN|nr:MerR family transcriptional regulator [Nocardioides pocheonensis]RNM11133.1 MerR family transcriptional regulator [Nocardioides pocheonensis]